MYRQIVRFYVFVLTLLEISLNSKLTAQGKSHGVIHEPLLSDGISFQDWGKEAVPGGGGGAGGGAAPPPLQISPPALRFGRAELGAAHALTVTVTNGGNATLHLASVAGTTPDFHASFFDSKTLPPLGNTSFSVVYVGRREGAARAHLYIHTSLGVYKYPVSAVGVPSAWGVWPLVELEVPEGAEPAPLLTLTNPTAQRVQVVSVYSSAPWLGLELPAGGAWAARALWTLPPHASRPLVRLRVAPPPPPPTTAGTARRTLTGYIRIKTEQPLAAPLVVVVEARPAPPGAHADPLHLRAGTRGDRDSPLTFDISLGNSGSTDIPLEPSITDARCAPLDAPLPTHDANGGPANGREVNGGANGGPVGGAKVTLLTTHLEAKSDLNKAATVTFDWRAMSARAGGGAGSADTRTLCSGKVQVGGATLPYSAVLLPGTVRVDDIHVVSLGAGDTAEAGGERAPRPLSLHNQFQTPLRVWHARLDPPLDDYFHVTDFTPLTVQGGASSTVLLLRRRAPPAAPPGTSPAPPAPPPALRARVLLHTNVTVYPVNVYLYSGELDIEWEYAGERGCGEVHVGAVPEGEGEGEEEGQGEETGGGAGHVRLVVRSRAPVALPLHEVTATHGATAHCDQSEIPAHGAVTCRLAVGGAGAAVGGVLSGEVRVRAGLAAGALRYSARACAGHVRAHTLALRDCAQWVECRGAIHVRNTMSSSMTALNVLSPDPAFLYIFGDDVEIPPGQSVVGEILYRAELSDAAPCYTGIDHNSTEWSSWMSMVQAGAPGLPALAAALRARAGGGGGTAAETRVQLRLLTTHVKQIPLSVHAQYSWPRLAVAGAVTPAAAAAALGARHDVTVRVRNPASAPLLLYPLIHHHVELPTFAGGTPLPACHNATPPCLASPPAFKLSGWRRAGGPGGPGGESPGEGGILLEPGAEIDLVIGFRPEVAANYYAYLYLRNNLTLVEAVRVSGVGAAPRLELAGRRAGSSHADPIHFEINRCESGTVVRALALNNVGAVPVEVRRVTLSAPFRLRPAPGTTPGGAPPTAAPRPATLRPNETLTIEVVFTTDWTLSRVAGTMTIVLAGGARLQYPVAAAVAARLLPACGAAAGAAGRAAWEPGARLAAAALSLLLAALALALAALDSEAILRRALAALHRAPPSPAAPVLDLRAFNRAPSPSPPPTKKRKPKKKEAFWRLPSVEAAALIEDDSSRSSEEPEEPPRPATPVPCAPRHALGEQDTGSEREEDAPSSGGESSCGEETAAPRSPPPAPNRARPAPAPALAPPTTAAPRRADPPAVSAAAIAPRRPLANKFYVKKDKTKRVPRVTSPRPPPPPPPPPPADGPRGTLRRGATFSEVVARADSCYSAAAAPAPLPGPPPAATAMPALAASAGSPLTPRPLAPIGSALRRRGSPEPGPGSAPTPSPRYGPRENHSLFYFNGDVSEAHYCAPTMRQEPHLQNNYNDEPSSLEYGGARSTSLWAGDGGWSWSYSPLRPPPGFPAPPGASPAPALPPAPAAPPFDPFHALAAIWASDRPAWAEPDPPLHSASPPPPADGNSAQDRQH